MNRRDFIKLTAIAGIGLSIPRNFDSFIAPAEASEKIDLAVAHGVSPSKITRAAIDAMGGMKKFVSKGDIVVVKPNIAFDRLLSRQQLQPWKLLQL